jgi:glutamine synthetase adenylyltransferase
MRKKSTPDFSRDLHLLDLKKSGGGLTDVEYLIHYLLLSDPQSVKLVYGKPFIKTMEIVKNKFKPGIDLANLKDCYYFLKQVLILNQIFFNAIGSKISADEEILLPLVQFLKIKSTADLKKRIDETMKTIRALTNKYLK